ncbi:MAG: metal-dependent hydrolase [candidate division WOR-3 bacterium]
MNWPEHMLIGALAGALVAYFLGAGLLASSLIIGMASVSALAPDIDHDSSKIRQAANLVVPLAAFSFAITSACETSIQCVFANKEPIFINGLAVVGLYMLIMVFLKPRHRGVIHTLSAAAAFGFLIYALSGPAFAIAGFAGYFSHLIADRQIKLI